MTERRSRWTLMEVLDWTRGHFEAKSLPSPRLDAEVLLAHVLGTERVMLYARFDQPLAPPELERMRKLVAARAAGTPVAHLVGRREFWSLDLEVTPDVLVPRPETEVMVEVGRRRRPDARRLVDVGTGSGAALLALLVELPEAHGWGLEVSPAAAEVARRNVVRAGLQNRATIVESALLDALPDAARPVDLLVANLPYIRTVDLDRLPPDVRDHEPHLALDGGPDGLDLIRAVVPAARDVLSEGGVIALESDPAQISAIRTLLEEAGLEAIQVARDLASHDRITSARSPTA